MPPRFLILTILSLTVLETAHAQTPVNTKTKGESHFYDGSIRSLDKTIRIYHYGRRARVSETLYYREEIPLFDSALSEAMKKIIQRNVADPDFGVRGPVDLKDPVGIVYLDRMTKNAQSGNAPTWTAGDGGIYAAIDPIQSISYMHDPGFLMEITIPKGALYYELESSAEGLSPNQINELRALGVYFTVYGWQASVHCVQADQSAHSEAIHIFDKRAAVDFHLFSTFLERKATPGNQNTYAQKRARYAELIGLILWARPVQEESLIFDFVSKLKRSLGPEEFQRFLREIPGEEKLREFAKRIFSDVIRTRTSIRTFGRIPQSRFY